jgi:hypothetical protein
MAGFKVEQECPQCGGRMDLEETDRLMACSYCGVKNFIYSPGLFRFVMGNNAPGKEIVYVPYLRFKGSVFSCRIQGISHRIVDFSRLGTPFKNFPFSLGLRPQTLKMRYSGPDIPGRFLKCFLTSSDLLEEVSKQTPGTAEGSVLHRALIGEAINLIYLPLYVEKGVLFDAITNNPIVKIPEKGDLFSTVTDRLSRRSLIFLPTLCPKCGWNLEGERDSIALVCRNCQTVWEAIKGRLVHVDFQMVDGKDRNSYYLPFWKMSVEAVNKGLSSYADFVRMANLPKVIMKSWEDRGVEFWSPAFKIRPKLFLYLAKRLTVSQMDFAGGNDLSTAKIHPVTLALSEAVQSLKVTLAASAVNRRKVVPLLPDIKFSIKGATLVYLPFHETSHEMVQEQTGFAINKNALQFSRFL